MVIARQLYFGSLRVFAISLEAWKHLHKNPPQLLCTLFPKQPYPSLTSTEPVNTAINLDLRCDTSSMSVAHRVCHGRTHLHIWHLMQQSNACGLLVNAACWPAKGHLPSLVAMTCQAVGPSRLADACSATLVPMHSHHVFCRHMPELNADGSVTWPPLEGPSRLYSKLVSRVCAGYRLLCWQGNYLSHSCRNDHDLSMPFNFS